MYLRHKIIIAVMNWICAWVSLLTSLVSVISLGFWWPSWTFEVAYWRAFKELDYRNYFNEKERSKK